VNKKVIRSTRENNAPVTGTEVGDTAAPVVNAAPVLPERAELEALIADFKDSGEKVDPVPSAPVEKPAPVEAPVKEESAVLGSAGTVSVPDSTPVTAHTAKKENFSEVYTMRKAAYLYRIKLMNESMGPGVTCGMEQAALNQKEYSRVLEAFITTIPPEEVRSAMTVVLNEYNTAPVLSPRCLMKGTINTKTSEQTMPEWFVQLSTLFSMASKPETRFQTVGKTFDLNRVSPKVPVLLMERIQEFFRA
jgi:hypothetical protein